MGRAITFAIVLRFDAVRRLYKSNPVIHNGAMIQRPTSLAIRQLHDTCHRCVPRVLLVCLVLLLSGQSIEIGDDQTNPTDPVYQEPEAITPDVKLDRDLFLLDRIRDRRPLDDVSDTVAYYGILNHVRRVDPLALSRAADDYLNQRWKDSEFAQLPREEFEPYVDMWMQRDLQHPYRGQPVTLTGHINLLRIRDHDENPYGLSPVYEAYLYTTDSQSFPATIIFTENPDNLAAGAQRSESVEVTGYFLKLYSYRAVSGATNYSPLIVAKEVRLLPEADIRLSPETQWIIAATIVGLIGGLVLFVWWTGRATRARSLRRQQAAEHILPPLP